MFDSKLNKLNFYKKKNINFTTLMCKFVLNVARVQYSTNTNIVT